MLISFISSKVIFLQFRTIRNDLLKFKYISRLLHLNTLGELWFCFVVFILPIKSNVVSIHPCIYGFLIHCCVRLMSLKILHINTSFFFSQESKLASIVYLENLMMFLWECHFCAIAKYHGVSAQVGKRSVIHYFNNYFTVNWENRWRLLMIYRGEQVLTYYWRLCFKKKEVQTSHF